MCTRGTKTTLLANEKLSILGIIISNKTHRAWKMLDNCLKDSTCGNYQKRIMEFIMRYRWCTVNKQVNESYIGYKLHRGITFDKHYLVAKCMLSCIGQSNVFHEYHLRLYDNELIVHLMHFTS